jgi:hypothetical protein
LRDQKARTRLGLAARQFVEDHHNWESAFAPLDDLFPQPSGDTPTIRP